MLALDQFCFNGSLVPARMTHVIVHFRFEIYIHRCGRQWLLRLDPRSTHEEMRKRQHEQVRHTFHSSNLDKRLSP